MKTEHVTTCEDCPLWLMITVYGDPVWACHHPDNKDPRNKQKPERCPLLDDSLVIMRRLDD